MHPGRFHVLLALAIVIGEVACGGGTPRRAPVSIANLAPGSGEVGTPVNIIGTGFGTSQGTSTVTFNGTVATVTNWSASSVATTVPAGATTGNVVVTVNGLASNGVIFTVAPPAVAGLNPSSGPVGGGVTISGTNFG